MAYLSMHFSIERVPLPLATHNTSRLVQMMAILERATANESKEINSAFYACFPICCDQLQWEFGACALQTQLYCVESLSFRTIAISQSLSVESQNNLC